MLDVKCLSCHRQQQIPSAMIYRKYLLKYSTNRAIKSAIYHYIKNPKEKQSIMPKPFFDKFPRKKRMNTEDRELEILIDKYIDRFDIKKRLKLKKSTDKSTDI
jgi:hypothetical protein